MNSTQINSERLVIGGDWSNRNWKSLDSENRDAGFKPKRQVNGGDPPFGGFVWNLKDGLFKIGLQSKG